MTASLILNSHQYHRVSAKTREKVEKIATELNYRPNQAARQLTGKRSGIIGLLMPRNARDYAFHRLQSIDREVMRCGYRLMAGHISAGANDLQANLADFEARSVEGLIWMGHREFANRGVTEVMKRIGAVVLIGEPVPPGVNCVMLDYAGSVKNAVEHLLQRGRTAVAMAVDAAQWIGNRQRTDGYLQALQAAGIKPAKAIIWRRDVIVSPPRPDQDAIDDIVEKLVIQQKADAIVANNDLWAAEIIKRLRVKGIRVPEDVAVVGQDNSELAEHFDPPITSLDLQSDAVATAATELLLQAIEHPEAPPEKRGVTLKLVLRASTGDA